MPSCAATTTQSLVDGIAIDGYAIVNDFLPPQIITALANEAQGLMNTGSMHRARTGQHLMPEFHSDIRGDFIHWLDDGMSDGATASSSQANYFARMQTLCAEVNRELYLGLIEFESHFTVYPPGAVYRKHLDQFRGNEQRQLSSILYLNQGWQHAHGGQLRIYLNGAEDTPYRDVEPIGGKLVLFLSGRFWHEVLPATQPRISLTGWFRTRA